MATVRWTEELIRERSLPASYERRQNYFRHGMVLGREQRGPLLVVAVAGSEEDAYQVGANLETLEAGCSRPFDFGGLCKHIVAALLSYLQDPEVEHKPPLDTLLEPLSETQLRDALLHLLVWRPGALETLEDFLGAEH